VVDARGADHLKLLHIERYASSILLSDKDPNMTTFTHIALGTNDVERARRFYDSVLAALGWSRLVDLGDAGSIWGDGKPSLMVALPRDGGPATVGNGVTVSFEAPSHDAVRAFHAAALSSGSPDEGAVGPRPWAPGALAAYTRDPDGNKLAVYGFPTGLGDPRLP
jgi:catechol 2,3-dioxygenase-like lactoylglutathione lyase family enzyme